MGRALGTYGVAAHRLEEAVADAARALDLKAQTFSTPTSVFVSVEIKDKRETMLARVDPRGTDLSKIVALDDILFRVIEHRLSPDKAIRMIKRVVLRKPRYNAPLHIIGYAVGSTGVARFFGGGWREMVAAGVIGLLIGTLSQIASRKRHAARLIEFFAGAVAALFAAVATLVLGPLAIELVTVAGLVVLMPGMTITTAMAELATRNLVSGTARLVGAITVVLSIGLGVAVGQRIATNLPPVINASPIALPVWTEILAACIAPLGFVILFNARGRDAWVIAPAGTAAYFIARGATQELGTELGVCATAAAVGVAGNLYARIRRRPASTVILPGLLMLVPGSLSFRSFEFFLAEDTMTGTQTAFRVLVTALALAAGLLLANVAAAPKRSL